MSDQKKFRLPVGDIQQQDIVERYNEEFKKITMQSGKILLLVLAMGFAVRSDISENSKKWTHETERSRIQQWKDVVNEIVNEFKRGMYPRY